MMRARSLEGGVTRLRPDGSQQLIAGNRAIKTNGFAILPDRSFLLAHLDEREDLPPTNFVHARDGVTWIP